MVRLQPGGKGTEVGVPMGGEWDMTSVAQEDFVI